MQWYGLIVEIETRNDGGELLKRDCPIRRHLKVIMVVDGDEEEEDSHVYPITCVELLSEEVFSCLDGRQNWDTLGHPIMWTI
jgi:hypothetical protein